MKNAVKSLILLLSIIFIGQATAQNTKKVWVEAGKSAFLIIPAAERGKASAETKTETQEFSTENGSGKLIARVNPDGKIVSIEVVLQRRMQINLNYGLVQEGYISTCCDMCRRLGEGWLCCIWCKLEHSN